MPADTVIPFRRALPAKVSTRVASVTPLPPPRPILVRVSPGDVILRRPQVERRTGLSRSTLYRRMTDGSFPAAVDLGGGAVGWRASDIDRWIANRPRR